MAKIDKKIMAFTGTAEATGLISDLAEYTDNIYAAVASEYGGAPHPGGNITLLSKYMDAEKISSWIDRVGIDIIIDGCAIAAEKETEIIRSVCEEKGKEYFRIAADFEINSNTEICRNPEELIRAIEYTTGHVLVKGNEELYSILTKSKDYLSKIILMLQPEPEQLADAAGYGYTKENMLCISRQPGADFLISLFNEFEISHFVMMGSDRAGMTQRLEAVNHSSVKASIYGDIQKENGYSAGKLWSIFAQRFGIGD